MSDLKTIKKRILRENKLEQIYEAMGCDYIKERNNRIEAGLPDHFHSDNHRCVQTKFNEHLSSSIRNRDFKGDIFFLVSYIVHNKRGEKEMYQDLHNAKKFICETLGWNEYLEGGDYKKRVDYLAPLRAIVKNRKRKREVKPNPVLPESILEQYVPYPSEDWLEEGISYNTQLFYGISFDLESKRIIIPMRNRFGALIGVKGRILHDDDDERKYMYLYKFNNSQELFNLHIALPYILMHKTIYVFEGEKSPMKMFNAGVYNAVSIGQTDITDLQAEIIKRLGLDIKIVLCYDTDKSAAEVKKLAQVFTNREVYAILDVPKLLPPKSSPIDLGIEVFRKLEAEHCYLIPPEESDN